MESYKIQIYRLVKKNIYPIIILLIGIFFLIPILNTDFYLSHDGEAHVARFAAYYKSFLDGQFPPRWAADLNFGYGSPIFVFFYPLPGYIASIIHFFGFSFETVFKIMVSGAFLLSPIFLYIWLKEYAKKEIAFFASVIYLLLPYRFLDAYVRGDVAELLSLVFVPLIFLYLDKSLKKKKMLPAVIGGFFYALFILSHNGIAFIFTPVFLAYSIVTSGKLKNFLFPTILFSTGIILATFFWLPSLVEGKYVMGVAALKNLYEANFVSFLSLFYSDWGFGADVNLRGGLSAQIGIIYAAVPFIVLLFINKFKQKKIVLFWTCIFFFSFFMTTEYSRFLWDKIPILYLLGFPWRFTALSGFASCILIFYILQYVNKKTFLIVIVFVFAILSLSFARVDRYVIGKNDNFYFNYSGTTDYNLRTNTIWTAGEFYKFPQKNIDIIAGQGIIKNVSRGSTVHDFKLIAETDVSILDNTVYFPGWRVFVDGQKVPIEFQDINHRGLITFKVNKGTHSVKIMFLKTPVRLFSDFVSGIGVFVIILFIIKDRLSLRPMRIKK